MSVPTNTLRAGLRRAAPALPAGLTAGVVSAWACVGLFGVVLKAQRVWLHPQRLSVSEKWLLLAPDLGFAAGMTGASLLLALLLSRLGRAGTALRLAQLMAALCVVLETFAHGYFLASGQPLDYAMFAFSLARADERIGVVGSEASFGLLGSAALCFLGTLAAPSWLWRRTRARRAPLTAAGRVFSWPALGWLLAFTALSFALTDYSPARRIERSFARDPVSGLALGMLRSFAPPDTRYRGKPSRPRKLGTQALKPREDAVLRNIVVVMLESTRADATTAYQPSLRTTPFLERFARESVLVERAYAVVPHTTKALVTILCGFEPEVTLSNLEARPGGLPGRCLPSLLAAQGYDTAFFQAPTGGFEDRRTLAENLGFTTFVSGDRAPHAGLERINYFGYEDAIVLGPSAEWLDARGGRPFLAAYLTSASHHPYGVPSSHAQQKFANGAKNKYLNAIRYTDSVVERIVEQYRKRGLLDDTVFLIVGDHGEAFGEHGLYTHDDVMFEEGLRVPLLLRLPGAERAGQRVAGPISELAIVPTLITAAGFAARDAEYEHANLLERPSAEVLYAHCYRGDRCAALIRQPYKLLDHFDDRPAELYDLSRDPHEEDDLADDHPELVERWSRELADVRLAVHETYRHASARALDRYISDAAPNVPVPLPARFGNYLELLGLRVPTPDQLRDFGKPSSPRVHLSYFFHVLRTIPPGYSLRVHMRGTRGSVTDLHQPLRGLLPLADFPVGQYIEDAHRVSLPDGWRSPSMTLCLALFDDRSQPVAVTQPGKPEQSCVSVLTLAVQRGSPSP